MAAQNETKANKSDKFLIIDFSFLASHSPVVFFSVHWKHFFSFRNLIFTFIFATARNIVCRHFRFSLKSFSFPYSHSRMHTAMWAWGSIYDSYICYFHGTLMPLYDYAEFCISVIWGGRSCIFMKICSSS